jgi:hypothetical protein
MIKGSKSNFDQLIDNYQDLGLYDYGSVMHYIAFAFSRYGGPVQGDNHQPRFAFDHYGVRIPAVIASPYIQKGTILRPSGNYPGDGALPFDHASVINTLCHRFGLGAS